MTKEENDLLDWDEYIDPPPPPIRKGTIKMKFKCIGWAKPDHVKEIEE
jgi:hypothetical protein